MNRRDPSDLTFTVSPTSTPADFAVLVSTIAPVRPKSSTKLSSPSFQSIV
jgi:hypothetical protein